MTPKPISATAVIDAPAAVVYGIIADYRDGHPHILPAQYFTALEVDEGGLGAGTVIRVTIATELGSRGGIAGWLEGLLTPSLLKPIYAQELELLRQVAAERARTRTAGGAPLA